MQCVVARILAVAKERRISIVARMARNNECMLEIGEEKPATHAQICKFILYIITGHTFKNGIREFLLDALSFFRFWRCRRFKNKTL